MPENADSLLPVIDAFCRQLRRRGLLMFLGGWLTAAINFVAVWGGTRLLLFYAPRRYYAPDEQYAQIIAFGLAIVGTIAAFVTYSESNHNAWRDEEYLNRYPADAWAIRQGNPYTADRARSFAGCPVMWFLYCAPMLIYGGWHQWRAGGRLAERRTDGAVVLQMLDQSEHRIAYDQFPVSDIHELAERLAVIDGIMQLRQDPPGLAMSDELRQKIAFQRKR